MDFFVFFVDDDSFDDAPPPFPEASLSSSPTSGEEDLEANAVGGDRGQTREDDDDDDGDDGEDDNDDNNENDGALRRGKEMLRWRWTNPSTTTTTSDDERRTTARVDDASRAMGRKTTVIVGTLFPGIVWFLVQKAAVRGETYARG